MSIYTGTTGDKIIYADTKDFKGQEDVIIRTDGEYKISTHEMTDLKKFFMIAIKTPTQEKRYLYQDKHEACLAHLHYVNCILKWGEETEKYGEPNFIKAVLLKN